MHSFKSIKNAFKKRDKASTDPSKDSTAFSSAETSTHPSKSPSNGNASVRSIGRHSNASSITRADMGVAAAEEPPLPAVPSLPAHLHNNNSSSSSSLMDLAGYTQPQLAAAEASMSPRSPRTPLATPSNPQLTLDSPLIRTQIVHSPVDNHTRPTEIGARAPHSIQPGGALESETDAGLIINSADPGPEDITDDPDLMAALHRSGTLPPSYNSLNIPLSARNNNMHAASAPSPDMANASAPTEASVVLDNYPATSPAPMPYVVPPPAGPSPLGNQVELNPSYQGSALSTPATPSQQQTYQQSYAPSSSPNSWIAQQAYSPSPIGTQHYAHRPYVVPGSENQTYPIIMAIDWGTTYSSMAYAYQQDGEVHEVSSWPKQTHNYPKVPTCNLYGPGSKEIVEWGYPAKIAITKPPYKNHVLLSKYKLHLDDSAGPHPPLPNGLTIIDAIADYLRLFHAHVVESVLKGFGASFEQQHIQYCLSVPAMWTDNAKAMMRQAALQAGMISPLDPPHRLLLISEPEAAALYCEKKCDQFSIGHGQRFMICDAGGGTVDLIVFEVAVGPHGRTLREVTRGSGHSCGSIFLDERMEALLRRRFAKWQEKGLTAANWVQLMETFIHNVKPLFDGVEDQYITMPAVPGRADLTDHEIGLEDGILTITAEEMRREVFDPVVNDVLRLIQHQLQQTHHQCHAIFLVGGFGCSGYLHTRVKAEFGARVPMIGIPPRAELAVVRGAVYAGLMPKIITQRVARRWYGVDSLMAYEEGVDVAHKKVRDRQGLIRARDRFSVYVSPGQQIGVDECITKRYITYQYPKPVNSPLFACSSMNLPRYVDSPLVEKIGDFSIPLPFVPGAQPGHKMVFELRMYFGATEIRAEAEVNGMVVSTRCQFSG
ncbi:Heat shock 70 kDa protein 12A [Mortierella claussenii]|nr:Heat shock 70 kDa protein 12A [Mortierella claussenii]